MSRKMTRSGAARATALMASLSMAVPFPLYAQSGDACADGSSPPCESQEGVLNGTDETNAEDGGAAQDGQQQETQQAEPEAQPGDTPEPAPEEVPADPQPEVQPDPAPEQQPVPDETPAPAPEEVPQPDQAPEIPAEGATEDGGLGDALNRALGQDEPAEAEAPAAEEPTAEEPAAEDPAPEEPAAEEAAPEAPAAEAAGEDEDALRRALEQEQDAAEQPAEEAAEDAAPAPEAESDRQPGAAETTEQPAEESTTDPAAEEGGLGAALNRALGRDGEEARSEENQAEEVQSEEGQTEESPAEGSQAEAEATTSAEEAQPDAAAEEIAEERARQLLVDQPDAASGEPPAALEALNAAEDGDDAQADVEVMEETVTEDSARSSSEDFDNTVNQRREDRSDRDRDRNRDERSDDDNRDRDRADRNRDDSDNNNDDDDDDRWNSALSDREKVMLLGLGALAVGAVISNNRRVELNSGDRVVVQRPDGTYEVIKDDDVLLRQPGSNVRTEQFRDGSSRTTVTRDDGSQIVTIYSPEMRVLRRTRIAPNGQEYLLVDDTVSYEPVDVSTLPQPRRQFIELTDDEADLRAALAQEADIGRTFSLSQIRNIPEVRALVPVIDVNAITFETGSAAITPDQARALASVGRLIQDYIDENPREVFLIEGHTDAVGSAASNLALSDRRAESVALALTEYFDVPPENMIVQGYGESQLRVNTEASERANRRAAVRRITDLMRNASN